MIESPDTILRNLEDDDIVMLKDDLDENFQIKTSKDLIHDVFVTSARKNIFHPVKDYLESVAEDDVSRVETVFINYCGAEDTEYTRAVTKLFFMAAVRRIYEPGAKFDEMLILEAPQGSLKSLIMSTLAVREEWFSDNLPLNALGREILELTQGKWIVEAAELSGIRRADVEHLKSFLSRQADRGRKAYARVPTEKKRQFVIVGTTNSS
jgi:predicted P-loop ATPase